MKSTHDSLMSRRGNGFNAGSFDEVILSTASWESSVIDELHFDEFREAMALAYGHRVSFDRLSWEFDGKPSHKTDTSLFSCQAAAMRECGHFVACEYEKLYPEYAYIDPCNGSRNIWIGRTLSKIELEYGRGTADSCDAALSQFAVAMVAGPIAQEIYGFGKALGNRGILCAAKHYSDLASDIRHISQAKMWDIIIRRAISIVDRYSWTILYLHNHLVNNQSIERGSPLVKLLLEYVSTYPAISFQEKREALAQSLTSQTKSKAYIVEVGEEQ